MPKLVRVSIPMSENNREDIAAIAKIEQRSVADFIRRAVEEYIKEKHEVQITWELRRWEKADG